MRWFCMLLGLVVPLGAAAETRTTTVQVTVRKRAGEKAAAVVILPAGSAVEVVREEGRWVVIRANGAEGYVARTTLADPAPPAASPPVWSAQRRAGGALDTSIHVQVTAAPASQPPATAPRGAAVTAPSRARALALRVEAGVGYRSLGMEMKSSSDGALANYLVDADAFALSLGADVVVPVAGAWIAGADGALLTSRASPGIDYPGPSAAAGDIPFDTVSGEVGVRAGRRFGAGAVDLALRAGLHYDAFLTREVDNPGMLPRERLLGGTVGARAELRPAESRFGATLRADVLVAGERAQTAGLEDGTSSTARAVWGGVTVRAAFGSRWIVFGAYDFARLSTTWSGMSTRLPGVTHAERSDTSQLVQLGVGAEL